jgi:hypothetical protein
VLSPNPLRRRPSFSAVFRVVGPGESLADCFLLSTLFHLGKRTSSPTENEDDDETDWEMTLNRHQCPGGHRRRVFASDVWFCSGTT